MTRIEAIAFDLDGTLVDSAGGVAHALNAALVAHGLAPFGLELVRSWIGDGPDASIARALVASGRDAQGELPQRLRAAFDAATLRDPMAGSRVFDGIAEMFDSMPPLSCAVVTNKPTLLARAVLNAAGLQRHVTHVFGADEASQRKPAAHLLLAAAERLGVAPGALLMVGDGVPDGGAAQAAGCLMAWAGWGYGHGVTQTVPGAWHLDTPADLLPILAAHARGATDEH